MDNQFKIAVPEPCAENWDKMTPNENGRYCLSCSKTVIDFTSMLPEEIQYFFIQNQNEKICGRFKKSQLDVITIQIPSKVLYSQTHYHKMFLLALFITMGTTLFSCADKDGNKRKIDQIEVVGDTKQDEDAKQIPPPPPPPPKHDSHHSSEKLIKMTSGEVILESQTKTNKTQKNKSKSDVISTNCNFPAVVISKNDTKETSPQEAEEDSTIYITGAAIETKPNYPGGTEQFYQFFINEFKHPEEVENPPGRIIVSFVIGKDGSLSSFEFPKDIDPKIAKEIERVLKLAPNWEPSTQNGKKTRTKFSMPITIQ